MSTSLPLGQITPGVIAYGYDRVAVGYRAGHGRRTDENQDAYWPHAKEHILRPVPEYLIVGRLYIVADGVSQAVDGRQASFSAVSVISDAYYGQASKLVVGQPEFHQQTQMYLGEAILRADEDLLRQSRSLGRQHRELSSVMQATCACALIHGEDLYTAHVGDSRVYLFRADQLRQLTVDHTRKDGQSQTEELALAVGCGLRPGDPTTTYHRAYRLQKGDVLLLCSDGLYKYVSLDAMRAILNRRQSLQALADDLVEAAFSLHNGSENDDLVALLIEYLPPPLDPLETKIAGYYSGSVRLDDAITAAEQIVWWMPDYPIAQRRAIQVLAELYEERGLQLLDRDRELATQMLERARRLGYRGLPGRPLAISEYERLKNDWLASKGVDTRIIETKVLERLLPIVEQAAHMIGDEVWLMLLEIADRTAKAHINAGEWIQGIKYVALVQERLERKRLDQRGMQQYREFECTYQTYCGKWQDDAREKIQQLAKEWPWKGHLGQNRHEHGGKRLEELAVALKTLLVSREDSQCGINAVGPSAASGRRGSEVWIQKDDQDGDQGTIINGLTMLRASLLYEALQHLSFQRFSRAQDLTRDYQHWPEASAIYDLSTELARLERDPAIGKSPRVRNRLQQDFAILAQTRIMQQGHRNTWDRLPMDVNRLCRTLVPISKLPCLEELRWRFFETHNFAAEDSDIYTEEAYGHVWRALRWLEAASENELRKRQRQLLSQQSGGRTLLDRSMSLQRGFYGQLGRRAVDLSEQLERQHNSMRLSSIIQMRTVDSSLDAVDAPRAVAAKSVIAPRPRTKPMVPGR